MRNPCPAKSLTTGKEYRGINSVLLGLREYSSRYWATFKQTQKLGGNVRRGEKARPRSSKSAPSARISRQRPRDSGGNPGF